MTDTSRQFTDGVPAKTTPTASLADCLLTLRCMKHLAVTGGRVRGSHVSDPEHTTGVHESNLSQIVTSLRLILVLHERAGFRLQLFSVH
jgi:hypothetical protein